MVLNIGVLTIWQNRDQAKKIPSTKTVDKVVCRSSFFTKMCPGPVHNTNCLLFRHGRRKVLDTKCSGSLGWVIQSSGFSLILRESFYLRIFELNHWPCPLGVIPFFNISLLIKSSIHSSIRATSQENPSPDTVLLLTVNLGLN